MIDIQEITREQQTMTSIASLTSAFEAIASMHIARIKNEVQEAEKFFHELWPIYTRLQAGKNIDIVRSQTDEETAIDKELLIVITSENSLSGDIDHLIVRAISQDYDPKKHDIVVLGYHGASLMRQLQIPMTVSFRLPPDDQSINFDPLVDMVHRYRNTTVYYQKYITLALQEVERIGLNTALKDLSESADNQKTISSSSYIFEPSVAEVVNYMEESMLYVALNHLTLSSRLAQHASRFKAMTSARTLASDAQSDLTQQLNRFKRFYRDQRMREIVNGLQKEEV